MAQDSDLTDPKPAIKPARSRARKAAIAPTAAVPVEQSIGNDAMNEQITAAAETFKNRAEATFADAGERAKGAMEKGQKFFEDATDFNKGNLEALAESGRIAARGFEAMGQEAVAYAKRSYEGSVAAMRTLAAVKSPTEFMKLQGDFVRQSFDAAVAHTSHSTEASLKLAGEIVQPIQNRLALAAEKIKTAA